MPATLRDVAKLSGVSISTTSRALNDRVDVSPQVRSRVLAAARTLNYTVNHHARVLKGAASKTLGLILFNSNSLTFNATMTRGIYDIATAQGYSLIVCNSNGDADIELQAHQMLRQNSVDGLLINSVQSGAAPLQRLLEQNIPFVLLNRRVEQVECDYVLVDYRQGSYLAASHLLELGHRRIVYQLGAHGHPPTNERLLGYRQALAEYDIAFDPELVIHSEKPFENHQLVFEAMQRLQPRPTAIMAYNDEAAIPVLKALSDLTLRVPEDVSVVGQNDLSFAPYLVPPLTSIAQSIQEMGALGIEILLQKLTWAEGEPWLPQQVILEPRPSIRLSSARPSPALLHVNGDES
jgi:LacI family transcriptional regulator